MLVYEVGERWALVRQADHADLSGELAEAWGAEPFAAAHPSLIHAAHRHDDGWEAWDRRPRQDAARHAPLGFTEVPPVELLNAYRTAADVTCADDRRAGLLVSMHVSGLRRGRYGHGPDGDRGQEGPTGDAAVDRFVAEEEERQARLRAGLALADEARWHDYGLLQVFDVLSLHLVMHSQRPLGLARVPTEVGGPSATLELAPRGPGRVAIVPFPFRRSPSRFEFVRRLLEREPWVDDRELRGAWRAARPELVSLELLAA